MIQQAAADELKYSSMIYVFVYNSYVRMNVPYVRKTVVVAFDLQAS